MNNDRFYKHEGFWCVLFIVIVVITIIVLCTLDSIVISRESKEVIGVVTHADTYYAKGRGTLYALSVVSEESTFVIKVNASEYAKYPVGSNISFTLVTVKTAFGDYKYNAILNNQSFRIEGYRS